MTVLHCIVWCAVAAGKVTMATIDRALGRALTAKMSVPSHPVCNSHDHSLQLPSCIQLGVMHALVDEALWRFG